MRAAFRTTAAIVRAVLRAGVLAGVIAGAWSPAGFADQTDPRLGGLFTQLKAAGSLDEAQTIEARIWALWLRSKVAGVDTLMNEGMGRMETGDLDRALATFTEVTKRAPDFAEGWNKRATVLYMLGRPQESIADIGRVLALEPRHFGALSGLGLCEADLRHDKAAADAFPRALDVWRAVQSRRAEEAAGARVDLIE
jgi:tetratricopeptide (TPR) repeat protein